MNRFLGEAPRSDLPGEKRFPFLARTCRLLERYAPASRSGWVGWAFFLVLMQVPAAAESESPAPRLLLFDHFSNALAVEWCGGYLAGGDFVPGKVAPGLQPA